MQASDTYVPKTGGLESDAVPTDERGEVDGWVLVAVGLLVDAAAVAAMGAAIAFSSGGLLAVSLVVGNVLLVIGFFLAYRGRNRSDPD